MRARAAPVAALLMLGLGGCGGAAGPPPVVGPVEVTLGGAATDGSGFVPLAGDVTLISGAQGGFHFWMKYRVTGVDAVTAVRVAYTARRVSDARLVLTAERQQDVGPPAAAGYWEVPNAIPAFMCPSPLGVQVEDQPLRFRLDIYATDGTALAGADADVTPHCPEGDQATYCASICNG